MTDMYEVPGERLRELSGDIKRLSEENGSLRALLSEAREMLGVLPLVTEGPNAGWRGDGEDGWFEEDLIPDPKCPVEAFKRRIDVAIAENQTRGGTEGSDAR